MKNKKTWKIISAIISICYIIYLWVQNSIEDVVGTVPTAELIPLIFISVLVSLLKLAGVAAMVFLTKWIIDKAKHRG